MYLNILKKDLKRKKTMNVILTMFVIISTMFVSSSVSNILTVISGTDHYFEMAGMMDHVVIHSGDADAHNELESTLADSGVDSYKLEEILFLKPDDLFIDDKNPEELKNLIIAMSIDNGKLNYFDKNNEPITTVEQGKAYAPSFLFDDLGLVPGDTIELRSGETAVELELIGNCKDVLLGSKMFGNIRLMLNDTDYQRLISDKTASGNMGSIAYISSNDTKALKTAITNINGVLFSDGRKTIEKLYIIDIVIAAVLLVVSICLILVAVVVLKFTISFTLNEEFREIGVMKAIGLRSSSIRSFYITKYIAIAVIGSIIGFFASIPFGDMMLKSVSDKMVLGNDIGILVNILSSAAVVIVVFLFSWLCTSKIKKSTPIDAIRNGETGERFRKKSAIRIGNTKGSASNFIALNDVISSPKKFFTLMLAFLLCLTIVLTIVITASTLSGDTLYPSFGITNSDVYINVDESDKKEFSVSGGEKILAEKMKALEDEFASYGMPAKCHVEINFNLPISKNGNTLSERCQLGVGGVKATEYEYFEGTAPINRNEIALSPMIADDLGVSIGDTVTIKTLEGEDEYMVTALFDTMNNLGRLVRLNENFETDYSQLSVCFKYQMDFTDSPDKKEFSERIKKLKGIYGEKNVFTTSEMVADCIGVGDMMDDLKYLVLAVTMMITALVTILMERSFIADEKSEIAIMKAIGFRNNIIYKIHTLRFGIVSAAASVIAGLISIPVTKVCITPIFSLMGTRNVDYVIDPLEIFLIYPVSVVLITVITAYLTSLYTRTIKASDASNIE